MADNDITSISISAKANTTDATAQIKALATQLERLQKVTQSGIGSETGAALRNLATAMNSLNGTNISANLPRQFAALGRSLNAFGASLNSFNVGRLREVRDALRDMADAQGGMKTIKASGINGIISGTKTASASTRGGIAEGSDMGVVEHQTSTAVDDTTSALANQDVAVGTLEHGWSRLITKLKLVVWHMKLAMMGCRKFSAETKDIGESASKTTSKFGQLLAAMKRIAMYRAIRAALKAITQAFREGIQNLYQFSVLIDGTFKQSMDTLATSALYLKNSLGAMVAPIINALAPAIDILVDKFVDLLNIFNQFLAMITGASTWTKALKYPKQYAENMERAGGAAKELRATLLGFDEINRLDDLKARGGGGGTPGMDYSQMFEEVPLIKKSLSDMWEDFLEGGKSKFAIWAAGLAGILSLKLSGGLTGVFGGAAGSASLMSGFTATLLAAFAGFRLGNWLYYNVPGIRDFADDLMDAGLGDAIMKFQTSVTDGWKLMYDKAVEWGDKLNTFFGDVKDGWGLLADEVKEKWRRIFHPYSYEKQNEYGAVGMNWTIKPTADLTDFQKQWWKTLGETGLVFDGSQYQIKVKFLGDETEIVDWWGDHIKDLTEGALGGKTSGTPGSPQMPQKQPSGSSGGDVFGAIEQGMKDLVKTANGIVAAIPSQSYVPAYYTKKAKGGSVETGDLFLANEKEPELIGHIGNKTQVANNDQITESIRLATQQGNAESNMLLRQAVAALNGLLAKDTTVEAVVTADSITNGLARQNLRNGRTTVAVG